jgi:hypothetical protein
MALFVKTKVTEQNETREDSMMNEEKITTNELDGGVI